MIEQPSTSEMLPGALAAPRRRPSSRGAPPPGRRVAHDARPDSADAAAMVRSSPGAARGDRPVGVRDGGRRGRRRPGPAPLGRSRSPRAAGRARPRRAPPRRPAGPASSRSTSSSRRSTSANSPLDISAPMKPTARTGRRRTTSSGMSSIQRRTVALLPVPQDADDRALDEVGRVLDVAGRDRVPDGGHRLAGRGVPVGRPPVQVGDVARAAPRADARAGRRRRGGGSGTSGGCRRGGRRTGSSAPATRARPCRRRRR